MCTFFWSSSPLFPFQAHGEDPYVGRQLLTKPHVSIRGLAALPKGTWASALAPSPTERTPSMLCLHLGRNREPFSFWSPLMDKPQANVQFRNRTWKSQMGIRCSSFRTTAASGQMCETMSPSALRKVKRQRKFLHIRNSGRGEQHLFHPREEDDPHI